MPFWDVKTFAKAIVDLYNNRVNINHKIKLSRNSEQNFSIMIQEPITYMVN